MYFCYDDLWVTLFFVRYISCMILTLTFVHVCVLRFVRAGCESNRRDDVGEKSRLVKQKLLEEMLRQKRELERKQAERHKVSLYIVH